MLYDEDQMAYINCKTKNNVLLVIQVLVNQQH